MAKSSIGPKFIGSKFIGPTSVGTLVAAASAAGIPAGDAAAQNMPGLLAPGTTVSVEGGVAFSRYWATTFPGNPASLLPVVTDTQDKTGLSPVSSGPLESKNNIGGYGSFSIARTTDPTMDWRFSAAFYEFGTTTSAANAAQQFLVNGGAPFTNQAVISETDRFGFQTIDFDIGKRWRQGIVQFRAFAGLRGLHTYEQFNVATFTEGTDKVGIVATTDTNTLSSGTSRFTGAGPRVGLDFFVGSTWGYVGSVSAALIGGVRSADFTRLTNITVNGASVPSPELTLSDDRYTWVGNLEGMLGVAWQFSARGQLVIGYRIAQWYNIRDTFDFAGYSNKHDVLTQNPFLKVSVRY